MTSAEPSARRLTGGRMKLLLILAGAALSGLVMLAWTQPWFTVTLTDAAELSITGEVAAAGLSALALAGLVLVVAISIAGPFFRFVLGALQALLGVAVVFSALVALGDPVAEHLESQNKAAAPLRAVAIANAMRRVR